MRIGIGLGIGHMRASGGFSPASLYGAGIGGDTWWPTREWAYTKSGGGVYEKVTTTGDLVARVVGMVNGINADQDTEASRPVYNEGSGLSWLTFDGSNDFLMTPSIDLTVTDKMAVIAGSRKASDAVGFGVVAELSASSSVNSGTFVLHAPSDTATPSYQFNAGGSTRVQIKVLTGYAAPNSAVLTGLAQISSDALEFRINGVSKGTSAFDQGTGSFGNHPLYIGRRGGASLPFSGNLYGLVVLGKLPSAAEIAAAEAWVAARTGVTL